MTKPNVSEKEHQVVKKEEVGHMPNIMVTGKATLPVPLKIVNDNPAQAFLSEVEGPRQKALKLPIISINHKEAQFVLPSGELSPEVSGYPINYFWTRRFYKKPPQPGAKGAPPDCWSADDKVPHPSSLEMQSETCASCAMNQWGTGRDGRSKACGTYLWCSCSTRSLAIPIAAIVAPPSSLKTMLGTQFAAGYFAQAQSKAGAYEIVWTTLQLEQLGDQVQYCALKPLMGEVQKDPESQRLLAKMRNGAMNAMRALREQTPNMEAEPA